MKRKADEDNKGSAMFVIYFVGRAGKAQVVSQEIYVRPAE